MSVCHSIHVVCLSAYIPVLLPVCTCMSVCISLYLPVRVFVSPCAWSPVCLSNFQSIFCQVIITFRGCGRILLTCRVQTTLLHTCRTRPNTRQRYSIQRNIARHYSFPKYSDA